MNTWLTLINIDYRLHSLVIQGDNAFDSICPSFRQFVSLSVCLPVIYWERNPLIKSKFKVAVYHGFPVQVTQTLNKLAVHGNTNILKTASHYSGPSEGGVGWVERPPLFFAKTPDFLVFLGLKYPIF